MFLMGPMKQLGSMFDKGRIVATCTYLASLGLTLWAALWVSFSLAALANKSNLQSEMANLQSDLIWP